MKQYFKNNTTPILVGISIGIMTMNTIQTIESIIIKLALIIEK